jgi:RNA:NAD 2'-phosphotransferase (TPT1/KptA family)
MILVPPKRYEDLVQAERKKSSIHSRQILQQLKYLLRHAEASNLWISNGWFNIDDVLNYLNCKRHFSARKIAIEDLQNILEADVLKIFEVKDQKIRAVCGHTTSQTLILPHLNVVPPEFLYIAGTHRTTSIWLKNGIGYVPNKDVILYSNAEIAFYNATKPIGLSDDFIRTLKVDTHTLTDCCKTKFRTIESEKVFLTEFIHHVGLTVYEESRLYAS